MHANPDATPGLANQSGGGPRPLVFRGAFLGFSGSTGNANGADVPSKHLHMYYRRADFGDNARDDVATLFGAAASPVPAWIVEAEKAHGAAVDEKAKQQKQKREDDRKADGKPTADPPNYQPTAAEKAARSAAGATASAAVKAGHAAELTELQKNQYPFFKGRVEDVAGKPFPAGTVRAVLYDRTPQRKRYVGEIAALSTADAHGNYDFYVPASVSCEIVFRHKGASGWEEQPEKVSVSLALGAVSQATVTRLGIAR